MPGISNPPCPRKNSNSPGPDSDPRPSEDTLRRIRPHLAIDCLTTDYSPAPPGLATWNTRMNSIELERCSKGKHGRSEGKNAEVVFLPTPARMDQDFNRLAPKQKADFHRKPALVGFFKSQGSTGNPRPPPRLVHQPTTTSSRKGRQRLEPELAWHHWHQTDRPKQVLGWQEPVRRCQTDHSKQVLV